MEPKKKKFNFTPRALSSNKNKHKKILYNNNSENSKNSKNVIQQNLFENNFQNIENKNQILNTDNNESIKPDIKYLMTANEKEQFDFINTFLKLKGIQKAQTEHKINNTMNNENKNISNIRENLINTIKDENINTDKKYQKRNLHNKSDIEKIYNSKTMYTKVNNIKEIIIDLTEPQSNNKKTNIINKKTKSPKIKSYDKKIKKSSNQFDNKIFRTKTTRKSPNKNIKIKNTHTRKNKNYSKDIEIKKKQLLEGKHLNLKSHKNFMKFNPFHKNNKINIHTEKSKKLNFPIINELEEDKPDILNIKVYKNDIKLKDKNNINKNNETIKTYINNDNDESHVLDSNRYIIKNNNSIISNEKECSSFISSSTFNNDLVNYKSIVKNSNPINNNINNISNTNFSIITNSMLNNDNNNNANEDKISFQIENNSDSKSNSNILSKDIEQNDISDIILLDNKEQVKPKVNIYENNTNSDNLSQNSETIIEQFDINNNFKQNESKEIKLSQISKDNKETINSIDNNNVEKSNINISLANISKLTNFVDSKFLEMSHYNNKSDNMNKNHKNKLPNKNDEINMKRIEHKKVKKIIPKKETNNNDNYFVQKLIEKEKEPQDRIRKESPSDNYRKKNKKLNTTKNSKKNIFEDDDISPTKKLILTNKRDAIYTPIQIVFNNQIEKRNKSKGKNLNGFTLNIDSNKYNINSDKDINKKKYYYTSISPDLRNNIKHINQNISIKNNINNNFIINYNK